jgi:ubiquinone/menaquinone biosynthesis C-methylase UbiE
MSEHPEKPTGFNAYAADYEELIRDPIREKFAATNRFFFERKLQVIRGFYKGFGVDTRKLDWLDAGCGQGDLLRLAGSDFKSAAGCDPSEGMLQSCSDLHVRQQPSMVSLPFDNQSFDFITVVCVYHHVPIDQRPAFTREAFRLLKPGGVFCVIEHNPHNPVTRLIVSRTPVDADAQLLSAKQTRRLLSSAGARLLKTQYFLLFPERIHKYAAPVEEWLAAVPLGGQYSVFAQRC